MALSEAAVTHAWFVENRLPTAITSAVPDVRESETSAGTPAVPGTSSTGTETACVAVDVSSTLKQAAPLPSTTRTSDCPKPTPTTRDITRSAETSVVTTPRTRLCCKAVLGAPGWPESNRVQ